MCLFQRLQQVKPFLIQGGDWLWLKRCAYFRLSNEIRDLVPFAVRKSVVGCHWKCMIKVGLDGQLDLLLKVIHKFLV